MCGICGFYGDMSSSIGMNGLQEMLNVMKHRGPDDEGTYFKKNAAIGMRRLSIIDKKCGQQPVCNEDKKIWSVFNGEIYNFMELKAQLMLKGHVFNSECDSEIIVHMYEEYGEKFVLYLTGMFAIALWDEKNMKMILARDRMGVKPLYYYHKNNTIIFASEVKSLLRCESIEADLNESALSTWLLYRYIPGEQTMFKGIYKLLPGHIAIFSGNELKTKQYWDMKFISSFERKPENYYTENIYDLFNRSLKSRISGDESIGIFLSGGLDSSIILSQTSKIYKDKIKTFSVAFEKPQSSVDKMEYDELDFAKRVSDAYSTEHYEYYIKPQDVIKDINEIIWYMDEPISDPTAIPLYYVSKIAKNHVRVVLSGEGADEIFAGYKIYREPFAVQKYNMIPDFIKHGVIEPLVSMLPLKKGKDFLRRCQYPVSSRYKGVGATFRESEISDLLQNRYFSNRTDASVQDYITSIFKMCSSSDEVNQMLYFDQKVWLPEDTLMKSDRMSMANSIELRVPFLDHNLVQFAARIPSQLKYKKNCEKYILKETFKNEIPDFVLKRKKNGFPVPISSLLNSEYKEFMTDILLSQRTLSRGYFKSTYIEQLLKNSNIEGNCVGRQLWLLLTFELWHRIFIDEVQSDICSKIS